MRLLSTVLLVASCLTWLSSIGVLAGGNDIQVLRIVRSYANGVFLHCPLTSHQAHDLSGVYQLKWLNEKEDFNKPDEQVKVTDYNLMLVADANLQISQSLAYVSCGFISNYRYVRIKMWQLVFVDNPSVEISISNNPSLVEYTSLNATHSAVSPVDDVNPLTWSRPCDVLRVRCKNNFDHPLNTRYVWMYVYNPATYAYEIWHKYDVDNNNEHEDNMYSLFYNPNANKKMYLYEFVQMLYSRENYYITFQCGSYYEEAYSKEKICLIANSLNITIIKGEYHKPYAMGQHHHSSVNTGLLIGVIIASVLAFLFLLALIGFLIWCCCCRRRSATTTKHTASSSIIFPAVNTSSCASTTTTCRNTEIATAETTSYNNMHHLQSSGVEYLSNMNACVGGGVGVGGGGCVQQQQSYLCSPSSSHMVMADKGSQFTNQMDYAAANSSSTAGICSKPPDVYLSMLTIHKDACDDDEISGTHIQQQCQEEFISAYHQHTNYAAEIEHHQDDLCHQNNYLQNCRPQQTEYNFHYV